VNRPTSIFAALASSALALSVQAGTAAQMGAPAQVNTATPIQKQTHRLALQIDVNDPAVMNLLLNNVSNVTQYYGALGQNVEVEVVAFGPGLHMLRDDTSPVKARIKSMSETMPHLAFSACGNTRENMTRAEAKDIPLISQARIVKAGVVRLMELQERGWTYLRP
jgi:uncharacterized protein